MYRKSLAMTALFVATCLGCDTNTNTMSDADVNENQSTAMESNTQAKAELVSIGDSGVEGEVTFVQQGDAVQITGKVIGLEPGKHGFHVHENGDLSDRQAGKSAGGHFDPTGKPHGKPSETERHVGDLGNIVAGEDGVATIDMQDNVIRLTGENAIAGRSLVIHAEADQFTQPTGDAGSRVAFGLIELDRETQSAD